MKYKNHLLESKDTISPNPVSPETVIIWGAGATASLGLATTESLGAVISRLCGIGGAYKDDDRPSVTDRIKDAFGGDIETHNLLEPLKNLLLLLYDGDSSCSNEDAIKTFNAHVEEMAKKYSSYLIDNEFESGDEQDNLIKRLESELVYLHTQYDWIGVRSIAQYIARKWDAEKNTRKEISLIDFLTTVDQLYEMDLGIPTLELFQRPGDKNNDIYLIGKSRLLGVKRCLLHLSATIQRIKIQLSTNSSLSLLGIYLKFMEAFKDLMIDEAKEYSKHSAPDARAFYLYSSAFVSFNWDPVLQWLIFNTNKKHNDNSSKVTLSKYQGAELKLFNDTGDGIGIKKIFDNASDVQPDSDLLAFMMNEQACRAVNNSKYINSSKRIMRIGKLLFPHGGFGWRSCPRCGKLFTDFGETISDELTSELFGPDLLPELQPKRRTLTEQEHAYAQYANFGAVECIFCGTITQPYDTLITLQSAVKTERHYIQEGILREMGLVVGAAKHLVFAGYSLPKDDYVYRCFFQSAWAGVRLERPYCSLINHDQKYFDGRPSIYSCSPWSYKDEILGYLKNDRVKKSTQITIHNMLDLFDIDRIRVCFAGIPNIFDIAFYENKTQKEVVQDILYPEKINGFSVFSSFPPDRFVKPVRHV